MNGFQFFVPGKFPNANDVINTGRGNKFAGNREKQTWTDRVALHIWDQGHRDKNKILFTEPVFVDFIWLEANKKRDPDNVASAKKFVLDGMVKAGLIKKDGWAQIGGFNDAWHVFKRNPGVIVIVSVFEPDPEASNLDWIDWEKLNI